MGDRNMHKKYLHYTYGFQIEPLSIEEDAEASIVLFWILYLSSFETKLILSSLSFQWKFFVYGSSWLTLFNIVYKASIYIHRSRIINKPDYQQFNTIFVHTKSVLIILVDSSYLGLLHSAFSISLIARWAVPLIILLYYIVNKANAKIQHRLFNSSTRGWSSTVDIIIIVLQQFTGSGRCYHRHSMFLSVVFRSYYHGHLQIKDQAQVHLPPYIVLHEYQWCARIYRCRSDHLGHTKRYDV